MKTRGLLTIPALLTFGSGARGQAVLWQFQAPLLTDGTGRSLCTVGDVDGDGIADVVAAALASSPAGVTFAGALRVLSGASGTVVYTVNGTIPNAFFGWWVGALGDMDGDGIPDFGANYYDQYTLVILSGADGSTLTQYAAWDAIGPGDLNGDGIADLVVGDPDAWLGLVAYAGKVDAYSGLSSNSLYTSWGPTTINGIFGATLSVVGDVTGDGVRDFAAGPTDTTSSVPYVALLSGATGSTVFSWTAANQSGFGHALVGVGDFDGDGVGDLGVGAPEYPFYAEQGFMVVRSGATGNQLWAWGGTGAAQRFGSAAGTLGDLDGDGFDDVLVSAPGTNFYSPPNPSTVPGRVFVFSGATGLALVQIVEPLPADRFGYDLDGAGDLNGDDFPDFVVGQPGYGPTPFQGYVTAYSGAPAGIETFGTGCPGSGGEVPRIGASESPSVGGNLKVNLSRTLAGTSAILVVGASDQSWNGTPLPYSMGGLGMPSCSLLASLDSFAPVNTTGQGTTRGRASITLAVPPDPSFAGQQAFAQWYVVDPGPAPAPGAMSRGLRITIQ